MVTSLKTRHVRSWGGAPEGGHREPVCTDFRSDRCLVRCRTRRLSSVAPSDHFVAAACIQLYR